MKTIKELEAEIKVFEEAYEIWNSKKVLVEERDKAERLVDELTDKDKDSHTLKLQVKALKDVKGEIVRIRKAHKNMGKDCTAIDELKEIIEGK